ncbi:endonuclease V [bacterium]|nr:endonuclease V [bacterium]
MLALDVDYQGEQARAGWVLFQDWKDATALEEGALLCGKVAEYEPGAFYKRELPCLLAVLEHRPQAAILVVDGFCWLGPDRPGLGWHLYQALGGRCSVVGVAKTAFHGNPGTPVCRGSSQNPLFVTACGLDEVEAARHIAEMGGPFRMPALLRRVDQLARGR